MSDRKINGGVWRDTNADLDYFKEVERYLTEAVNIFDAHVMDKRDQFSYVACKMLAQVRQKIANHDVTDAWDDLCTAAERYVRPFECGTAWYYMALAARVILKINSGN